jgi:hypothetical protein
MIITLINRSFVKKIPKANRGWIKEILKIENESYPNYSATFLIICPYCKLVRVFFQSSPMLEDIGLESCQKCGAVDPFRNAEKKLDEANEFVIIASAHERNILGQSQPEISQLLLRQALIMTISALDELMKDTYIAHMNMKYVKDNEDLSSFFEKEGRNDFVNPGKGLSRLEDAGIDIKIKTGQYREFLNNIAHLRHIYVHNSGRADKSFIGQTGQNVKLGDRIDVDKKTVTEAIKVVKKIITILETETIPVVEEFEKQMIENKIVGNSLFN